MQTIHGIPVYESEALTVEGEPYEVRRPWKERLFSWPWSPLQATRTVVPQVPDPRFYVSNDPLLPIPGKCIFAHPETARKLKEQREEVS